VGGGRRKSCDLCGPAGQNSLGTHFSLPGKTMSSLILYKAVCWEKDLLIL
jgi:hypothetical protein